VNACEFTVTPWPHFIFMTVLASVAGVLVSPGGAAGFRALPSAHKTVNLHGQVCRDKFILKERSTREIDLVVLNAASTTFLGCAFHPCTSEAAKEPCAPALPALPRIRDCSHPPQEGSSYPPAACGQTNLSVATWAIPSP
jgi:hypothetical protein